jgi:hypothetical protein
MRVYYLTGAQYALSSLALRRIKVARFEDLNDPFELLAVDLGIKEHRKAFRTYRKELNETRGLICFSRAWRNPLLWGHYAEKHAGVCLGFEIPEKYLSPVIYAKQLRKIPVSRRTGKLLLTEGLVNKLLRTKFFDWKYEEEMRLFVALDRDTMESGMYFCSFAADVALREVILGPRCELRIAGIREMVADFQPLVDVIKARLSFRRFEVLVDKLGSRAPIASKWGAPGMKVRPWLSSLAFLGFYVNGTIERGLGEEMSFEEVHKGLMNETLFEDLEKKFPGMFDLSLFKAPSDQRKGVLEALGIAAAGVEGRERRKVGISKNGLSLLMACILEAMQQGYWVNPRLTTFRKRPAIVVPGAGLAPTA